jgi:uncharacterized protein YggE
MTPRSIVSVLVVTIAATCKFSQAQAEPPTPPPFVGGITVSGECLTKVVQDRGRVSLGSTSLAPKPKEASENAIKAHEALKARVKALGLKDFLSETSDYSVFQDCAYTGGKRSCQGYRARITTTFETSDIPRLGDIVAVASEMGTEEVSALQTFASPELLKRAREACLEIAAKDAAAKAQKLASGAGVKVGRVLALDESVGDTHPTPFRARAMAPEIAAMSDTAAGGPSIDSRPIDLQVQISATYSIE